MYALLAKFQMMYVDPELLGWIQLASLLPGSQGVINYFQQLKFLTSVG